MPGFIPRGWRRALRRATALAALAGGCASPEVGSPLSPVPTPGLADPPARPPMPPWSAARRPPDEPIRRAGYQ